jgi:hypothetical protein
MQAPRSRREYARWRARQIAYGRWEPWLPAAPVREHVQALRGSGASARAIGRAACVSPMTVHRLLNGESAQGCAAAHRMRAREARRLLAVTPRAATRAAARLDAAGSRRRLQALTAVGYSSTALAGHAGIAARTVGDLVNGHTRTVSPALHRTVAALYDELWDQPPPEGTGAQRRAAAMARNRGAANSWPTPMGLDDEQIDDSSYRPRARWRPTAAPCRRAGPGGVGLAASGSLLTRPQLQARQPRGR